MREYKYYIVYMYVGSSGYIYENGFLRIKHKIAEKDLIELENELTERHHIKCMITFFSEVG